MDGMLSFPGEGRGRGCLTAFTLCFSQEQMELPEVPSEPLPEKIPGTHFVNVLWGTVCSMAKHDILATGPCSSSLVRVGSHLPAGCLLAPPQAECGPRPGAGPRLLRGLGSLERAEPHSEKQVPKHQERAHLALQALLGPAQDQPSSIRHWDDLPQGIA